MAHTHNSRKRRQGGGSGSSQHRHFSTASPDVAPSLQVRVRDSFHTAPGYREVSVRYSAIHDPAHPPEPAALDAIRDFFPSFIYVRKLWTFRSPSEDAGEQDVTFVRHCIASYVWNPHSPKPPFRVELPSDYLGPAPNQLDMELMYPNTDPQFSDLPGPYMPLSLETVANYIRPLYDVASTQDRIKKYVHAVFERRRVEAIKQQEEFAELQRDNDAYFQRKFDQLSDVEIGEYLREASRLRTQRQVEMYVKLQKALEKSPRVFVSNPYLRKDQ